MPDASRARSRRRAPATDDHAVRAARPQVPDRYTQYRGDVLGKPVNGYIAHNALQGWKLSPGFAKPHYSPEVARR